jgi:hypothetical protein
LRNATVVITWEEPDNGGQNILGYAIYIRKGDGVNFNLDFTYCDGSTAAISLAKECIIPAGVFISPYYGLNWGSSIYVKVIAYNSYGNSLYSDVGNGAVLMTIPSPQVNLAETTSLRATQTIALEWQNGVTDGGTPIVDYQVNFATVTGSFSVL